MFNSIDLICYATHPVIASMACCIMLDDNHSTIPITSNYTFANSCTSRINVAVCIAGVRLQEVPSHILFRLLPMRAAQERHFHVRNMSPIVKMY